MLEERKMRRSETAIVDRSCVWRLGVALCSRWASLTGGAGESLAACLLSLWVVNRDAATPQEGLLTWQLCDGGISIWDHTMDPRNTGELCIVILNLPPSWHKLPGESVSAQRTVSGLGCVEAANGYGWCWLLGTQSPWDLNYKLAFMPQSVDLNAFLK